MVAGAARASGHATFLTESCRAVGGGAPGIATKAGRCRCGPARDGARDPRPEVGSLPHSVRQEYGLEWTRRRREAAFRVSPQSPPHRAGVGHGSPAHFAAAPAWPFYATGRTPGSATNTATANTGFDARDLFLFLQGTSRFDSRAMTRGTIVPIDHSVVLSGPGSVLLPYKRPMAAEPVRVVLD